MLKRLVFLGMLVVLVTMSTAPAWAFERDVCMAEGGRSGEGDPGGGDTTPARDDIEDTRPALSGYDFLILTVSPRLPFCIGLMSWVDSQASSLVYRPVHSDSVLKAKARR